VLGGREEWLRIIKEIMKRDDFDSEKIKNRKCNKLLLRVCYLVSMINSMEKEYIKIEERMKECGLYNVTNFRQNGILL